MKTICIWLAVLFSVVSVGGTIGNVQAAEPNTEGTEQAYVFDTDESSYAARYSEYRMLPWGSAVTAGIEAVAGSSQNKQIFTADGKQGIDIGGNSQWVEVNSEDSAHSTVRCLYLLLLIRPAPPDPLSFRCWWMENNHIRNWPI